jgi:hypothetical protein
MSTITREQLHERAREKVKSLELPSHRLLSLIHAQSLKKNWSCAYRAGIARSGGCWRSY